MMSQSAMEVDVMNCQTNATANNWSSDPVSLSPFIPWITSRPDSLLDHNDIMYCKRMGRRLRLPHAKFSTSTSSNRIFYPRGVLALRKIV
ncbi:hypothetical protein SCLCIDRAFT_1213206, partial [Scleroderma citrinum Foug A]